jgi:restriction system protein
VADRYHRKGYSVFPNNDEKVPVDFVLRRGEEKVFVQCRRWNVWEVADRAVHELVGYATGAGAVRATMLTTGRFSDAARTFARPRGLELVDGAGLREFLAD